MILTQSARRFSAKAAAPLAVFLLTSGCGGGGSSNSSSHAPSSSSGILQPNVAPLPDDGSITFSNITPSSITLSGKVPALTPGMVIAGGPAPGVMRKVVSAIQSGNSEVIQTTDATLTDVFKQVDINFSGPIRFATGLTPSGAGVYGMNSVPSDGLSLEPSSNVLSSPFTFPNVPIKSASGGAGITLNGTASISMDVDCHIKISSDPHLNSARFVSSLKGQIEVTASAQANASLSTVPVLIKQFAGDRIRIAQIDVVVGEVPFVIPIWVTPELDLYCQADGDVFAGFNAESSGSITIGAGVQYQDSTGWSPVATFDENLNFVPRATAKANATFHITPVQARFQALFEGVLGPQIDADCPKFTIGLHSSPPPLTVDADFDAQVGMRVDIFNLHKSFLSPHFGKTFHLFPGGQLKDGSYEAHAPLYDGYYPWSAEVASFPDTNGRHVLEWVYGAQRRVPGVGGFTGFSASYEYEGLGPIYAGQSYTLTNSSDPERNPGGASTFGNYVLPGPCPRHIQVRINQGSNNVVSIDVSGAPAWMNTPPGNNFYSFNSGSSNGSIASSVLKQDLGSGAKAASQTAFGLSP